METIGLRYFNVFGPRQNPESRYSCVIPILVKAMTEGARPEIHWDGKQSRDFTYVADIVEGLIAALDRPTAVNPNWDPVNPDPATSGAPATDGRSGGIALGVPQAYAAALPAQDVPPVANPLPAGSQPAIGPVE